MRPRMPSTAPDRRGDEMPDWMADKQRRLERIRAAPRRELEAEAKAGPETPTPTDPARPPACSERGSAQASKPAGRPPDKAQRNFTDPDSRIMPTATGSSPATTARSRSMPRTRSSSRTPGRPTRPTIDGLVPLVDAAAPSLGRKPREVSADTGFASEANLAAMAERRIRAYLSPDRASRHGENRPDRRGAAQAQAADASPWPTTIRSGPGDAAATDCASRSSSRCSGRSSRPRLPPVPPARPRTRSEASGPCSAPPTTSSSCTEPQHDQLHTCHSTCSRTKHRGHSRTGS